jgi:hypothetical protein
MLLLVLDIGAPGDEVVVDTDADAERKGEKYAARRGDDVGDVLVPAGGAI